MKDSTFKGLSQLITGLMEEGKRAIANNVFNSVRHTLTTDQRKTASGIIKPRKESDVSSSSRVIDETELFLKYGDPDQKKRIVAAKEKTSSKGDADTNVVTIEEPDPFDNEQIGDLIKTVSPAWENATSGAIDLAKEYPNADWSVFVGAERITKNDIKAELQKQGYDI